MGDYDYNEVELPPGFVFKPSDEMMIECYLRQMISSSPVSVGFVEPPPSLVQRFDLYSKEMWNIPADYFRHDEGRNEAIILTPRYPCNTTSQSSSNSSRSRPRLRTKRTAGNGFWYGNSHDNPIICSSSRLVGRKTSLIFKMSADESPTNYILQEYILDNGHGFQSMALCKVYKKAGSRKQELAVPLARPFKKPQVGGVASPLHDHDQSVVEQPLLPEAYRVSSDQLQSTDDHGSSSSSCI